MSGLLGRIRPVDAAASVAPTEGLEGITPGGIGERLDVRPGLVSRCFPVVDELVAEAFGQVVGAELDILVPPGQAGSTPSNGSRISSYSRPEKGTAYSAVCGSTPGT
ncbi:hypothetical protein ACF07T_36625 [Streptomyces sp. NPDC015184]|uniref:hypothetical protein n=1 Tax=Streptomyces sp. NPDC015184 TaxID=3364946 RepID=UPI0036FA3349